MLPRNRHGLWLRLLVALGAMGLFVLGYQWGNRYQRGGTELPATGAVLVRPPGSIPTVTLQDADGRSFDHRQLEDGWTLLAFGDLRAASGQRAVQRLIDALNRVADQDALRRSLQLCLVDASGTAEVRRGFARLSPALRILGGDAADIARLGAALGHTDEQEPTLFLLGPGAYLIALFPSTETGAAVADDLKAIFNHAAALLPEES